MDHDLDIIYTWPLVLIIRDDYDPECAAPLLRGLQGLDDDSARMSVKVWAIDAEREIERN